MRGRWPGRPGAALGACLVLLAGGVLLHVLRGTSAQEPAWHAWGTDDAYITYRYARNLAGGQGLAYNPGEAVEGFSSLLHVLLVAPAFLVTGGLGVYAWATALNLLALLACGAALFRHLERRLGPGPAALGGLVLALCPVLWLIAAMGLEAPLVLLLQVLLWIRVEDLTGGRGTAGAPAPLRSTPPAPGLIGLAVLVVLLVLVRADGFLMPAAVVAYLLLAGQRRAAGLTGAALAAALALLEGWRLAVFGTWLPNTARAKLAGPLLERWQDGLVMLRDIALESGLALHLLALGALLLAALRRHPDAGRSGRLPPFGPLFALAWLAYYVHIGGDVYRERFLAILFPLGIAALLEFVRPRAQQGALLFVAAAVILAQARPLALDGRFAYTRPKHDAWITLGRFLGERHPGALLAVDAAGKIPFFSGLRTIDMLGLTEPTIARRPVVRFHVGHSRYDPDYVLSRRPDLIAAMSQDIDLNYRWGLSRERTAAAGYRLRYLLNCNRTGAGLHDVLDVSGSSEAEIRSLIIRGYRYGVLAPGD